METQSPSLPPAADPTLKRLILQNARNFVIGVIVLGVVLCLLAGTLEYWRGWAFAVLFLVLTTSQGIYLALKDPALLERRKQVAPKSESTQQRIFIIIGLASLVGLFVFSALDQRFGWSQMSPLVSGVGAGLMVLSFYLYYLVFRENSFAASSVQTFENQQVISTGPYAWVRHPKYVGDLVLVIGMPLALGSWWGLAFVLITLAMLVWRILDEEQLLKRDLPGYSDYMQQVRYRLVPYLW